MFGNMMHRPLSIIEILRFAVEAHPKAEVVSVRTEGDIHRYTYPDCYSRVGKLAHAGSVTLLTRGSALSR